MAPLAHYNRLLVMGGSSSANYIGLLEYRLLMVTNASES